MADPMTPLRAKALEAEVGRLTLATAECQRGHENWKKAAEEAQAALAPFLALAVAARDFWSECWDVSLPTVEKFQAALAHPAIQRAIKET